MTTNIFSGLRSESHRGFPQGAFALHGAPCISPSVSVSLLFSDALAINGSASSEMSLKNIFVAIWN